MTSKEAARSAVPITLQMAVAGGQAAQACLVDPNLMAKPNAPGELASRIFCAMLEASHAETAPATQGTALMDSNIGCQEVKVGRVSGSLHFDGRFSPPKVTGYISLGSPRGV